MSDPRYRGNVYTGAPLTTQQALNLRHRQYCDNHPASYGWTVLRVHKAHGLPVYHQSGVELMRCPRGDGWLVTYLGERRRVRLHVSELTARLDCIKRRIEGDIAKQFAAAKLAA